MVDISARRAAACSAALLILLVIILVVIIVVPTTTRGRNFLSGMWVGDPAFLRKAGLSDMQLYLSPAVGGERQGYLVMADENKNLVANLAFDLTESGCGRRQSIGNHMRARDKSCIDVAITFDGDFSLIPSDLTLVLCAADGSLSLKGGDKLFGFLWKDHAASSAAALAFNDGTAEDSDDDSDSSSVTDSDSSGAATDADDSGAAIDTADDGQ